MRGLRVRHPVQDNPNAGPDPPAPRRRLQVLVGWNLDGAIDLPTFAWNSGCMSFLVSGAEGREGLS